MNYFYIAFKYNKYQIKYTENVYSNFLVLELKTDKVLKIRAATKDQKCTLEAWATHSWLCAACAVQSSSQGVPEVEPKLTHTPGICLLDFSRNWWSLDELCSPQSLNASDLLWKVHNLIRKPHKPLTAVPYTLDRWELRLKPAASLSNSLLQINAC